MTQIQILFAETGEAPTPRLYQQDLVLLNKVLIFAGSMPPQSTDDVTAISP